MTPFGHLTKETQQHTAQTLLVAKGAARNIVTACESLIPLTQNGAMHGELLRIKEQAVKIGDRLQSIYAEMAKEAFIEN